MIGSYLGILKGVDDEIDYASDSSELCAPIDNNENNRQCDNNEHQESQVEEPERKQIQSESMKVAKLEKISQKIYYEKKGIDEFMPVEVNEATCKLLQEYLGWCPIPLSKQIDMKNDVPKICRPFVITLDESLIKASVSMANLVKCRQLLNDVFELIGEDSKTKSHLINLQMTIDKGIDNYAKNIQEAVGGFIKFANCFAVVNDILSLGGKIDNLLTTFQELEVDFNNNNDKLDQEMAELVENLTKCRQQILEIQNPNIQINLNRLEDIKNKNEQKFKNEQERYEQKLNDYKMKEIKLEEDMIRNNNQGKYYKNLLKQIEIEINELIRLEKSYDKIKEEENKQLKLINDKKQIEFQNNQNEIKKLIDEVKKDHQHCMKVLTDQIYDITNRIKETKEKLVELGQKEQEEIQKIGGDRKNFIVEYKRQKKREEYKSLCAINEDKLKHYDSLLLSLIEKKKGASIKWKSQLKDLENQLNKCNDIRNESTTTIQQQQQEKLQKTEKEKEKCKQNRLILQKEKKEIEENLVNIKVNIQTIFANIDRLKEEENKNVQEVKKQFEKAKLDWKESQEKYENEIKALKHKYGHYDISKVDTLNLLLVRLSTQCQNISLQFREISIGIKHARIAFSSKHFRDYWDLTSNVQIQQSNQQQATNILLNISNCYHLLGTIASKLFQKPLDALIYNDLNLLETMYAPVGNNPKQINHDQRNQPVIEEIL